MSTTPRTKKGKKFSEESETPSRTHRLSLLLQGLRKVSPRTPNQSIFLDYLKDTQKTVVIGGGLAGCGKSYMAVGAALAQLADPLSPYDELIIFKSVKQLEGEDMGFLPGDKNDKLFYVYQSFFMQLEKLLPPGKMEELTKDDTGCIKILPIGCIRGISISPTTIVIVDECQNLSVDNTHTVLTRFEEGAKLICIGDESQQDRRNKKDNGLSYLLEEISGLSAEIATMRFTESDCVRKKLIKLLQRTYDAYTEKRDNPSTLKRLLG